MKVGWGQTNLSHLYFSRLSLPMPANLNFFKTPASEQLVSSRSVSTSTGISGCFQLGQAKVGPGPTPLGHTLTGWRGGWGVNILEDAETALYSTYVSTLWFASYLSTKYQNLVIWKTGRRMTERADWAKRQRRHSIIAGGVKGSLKLVWMEATIPSNSLIGYSFK
jgi:hypothetical protein